MDKQEYMQKIDEILSDPNKFSRVSRDNTSQQKVKANELIDAVNAKVGGVHLQKITGEYAPGYLYGNVKTHKRDNPLRPIISQIPTPTYTLAKKLNNLLTPYVPTKYSLRSSKEFIDLLQHKSSTGLIASLDVESLFTNVPVEETIEMIIQEVYHGEEIPLDIPEDILRQLLKLCTKEAIFRAPDGRLYQQIDGVAMGSPLGVLFANFYMGMVERKVLENSNLCPHIYGRYIDDIFVNVKDERELSKLRDAFQRNSCLRFTTEINDNGSLPFLDVMVTAAQEKFKTTVFTKKTNTGMCLNAISETPQRYLRSVIGAYINRAFTHCSSWHALHVELERCTQVLVNNGYSNASIQEVIKKRMDRFFNNPENEREQGNVIKLYYRNYMNTAYKMDEKVLRDIIRRGVTAVEENTRIDLQIYYKNCKTSNLVIKNNLNSKKRPLDKCNVVYKYTCAIANCQSQNITYFGHTTTSLSRRLTMHLQNGNIKKHTADVHNVPLTREMLVNNTEIVDSVSNDKKLKYLEAIYINVNKPPLNVQGINSIILPSDRQAQ